MMDLSDISSRIRIVAQFDAEIQARMAWELLRLELNHWRESGALIHPHILALIHHRREALRQLAKDEAELLFRSALAAGDGIADWVERAWLAGVPVDAVSLEELEGGNFRLRAGAVTALGALGCLQGQEGQIIGLIIKSLVDGYPLVRAAAIRALERLQPEGQWRKQLVYECYVPAGQFVMGDEGSDLRGKKVPAHEVMVDAFYIGKYPVTNADFQRYMDDVGHEQRYVDDAGHEFELPEGKTNHPVVDVSWHQARDYAAWAGMRLLTEAEWEKAASWAPVTGRNNKGDMGTPKQANRGRGGGRWSHFVKCLVKRGRSDQEREGQEEKVVESRKQMYPWGNAFGPGYCNTGEAGLNGTTPVGIYSPRGDSPYGCADMVGNVWEWTSSLYRDYAYRVDDGREDMSVSGYRVVRGGSFFSYQGVARSASRFGLDPYFCNLYRGFRVGMSATPEFTLK